MSDSPSDSPRPAAGTICWHDITVDNADEVRDFYAKVIGWQTSAVAMSDDAGDYQDHAMVAPGTGDAVAGVCHARGPNADIPPQWLIYVAVDDVEACAVRCRELGGEVVTGPRAMGGGRLCIIRDPAGAVLALYQTITTPSAT